MTTVDNPAISGMNDHRGDVELCGYLPEVFQDVVMWDHVLDQEVDWYGVKHDVDLADDLEQI